MASLAGKAAARDDVYELVRLSWAYGGTDKEPEIDQALQMVASRLRARGKVEELAYMLNLPAQRGVSRAVNVSVDEKYAHRPGRGLATAAFVASIVCVAQLLIGLLLGDLLLPHVLGPTLAPVGPF